MLSDPDKDLPGPGAAHSAALPSNNQDRPANPAAFAGLYRGGYPRLAPIDSARRKVWPFFTARPRSP